MRMYEKKFEMFNLVGDEKKNIHQITQNGALVCSKHISCLLLCECARPRAFDILFAVVQTG